MNASTPTQLRVVHKIPDAPTLPFSQELQVLVNGQSVASLQWFAPASDDGVAQILDIRVNPAHQRRGHASALLRAAGEQIKTLFTRAGLKPRRVWANVEQKKQIHARAFLTRHGFHHVATITNLQIHQDGMVYLKAFD